MYELCTLLFEKITWMFFSYEKHVDFIEKKFFLITVVTFSYNIFLLLFCCSLYIGQIK